jgi:hypothetical protein
MCNPALPAEEYSHAVGEDHWTENTTGRWAIGYAGYVWNNWLRSKLILEPLALIAVCHLILHGLSREEERFYFHFLVYPAFIGVLWALWP